MDNNMDASNRREDDEIEIDLGEVFFLLLSRVWLILLCAVAAGVAGYLISTFVVTDLYQSTTKVYILNKDSGNGNLTTSDLQLGTQLTKDYVEMITSRSVIEKVIADNALTDETYSSLVKKTSVKTASDTRIISITVTDPSPLKAQYLADEIRKVAAERIEEVMNIEAVNTVDEANLPAAPSSPNVLEWAAIGFLLGAFACAGMVVVHYMLDDTIKTSEDVEKYLSMSTLGMIPTKEEEKHRKSSGKSKSGRSGKSGKSDKSGQTGRSSGSSHRGSASTAKERSSSLSDETGLVIDLENEFQADDITVGSATADSITVDNAKADNAIAAQVLPENGASTEE